MFPLSQALYLSSANSCLLRPVRGDLGKTENALRLSDLVVLWLDGLALSAATPPKLTNRR